MNTRGREPGRLERGGYLAIDSLLALEELAGFALSNRPARAPVPRERAGVVLVADRFPAPDDPLVELVRALGDQARVEAAARPERVDLAQASGIAVAYREDDGAAARLLALLALAARHPGRLAHDVLRRPARAESAPLAALAPAVRRLARDPAARVLPLGGGDTQALAERLARLAGLRSEEAPESVSGRAGTGGIRVRRS